MQIMPLKRMKAPIASGGPTPNQDSPVAEFAGFAMLIPDNTSRATTMIEPMTGPIPITKDAISTPGALAPTNTTIGPSTAG